MAKKNRTLRILTLAILLVMVITSLSVIPLSATGTTYYGSSPSITQNTNKIDMGTESIYNEAVMYKLPDSVKDTDVLSVIIRTKSTTLLDAYYASDTPLSFGEYSLTEEADGIRGDILVESEHVKNKLDGIDYTLGKKYDTLISGFEITIKAADYDAVRDAVGDSASVHVGEVYNTAKTELVENHVNVYDTGIFSSEDFKANYGKDGTGMVVAVLDTGIDYYHSAFSDSTFLADRGKLGLTFEKVKEIMAKNDMAAESRTQGLTPEDVYISAKIPYGFDYADSDSDVFPLLSNHGTHVSGVIAGNYLPHIESEDYTGEFEGVAPNAQIVTMKIFSDVEATSHTSWIIAALEDCVALGVDVINMSIGTTAGFSTPSTRFMENEVYDKIREHGTALIVAASNSFNSSYGSDRNGNLPLTSNPDSATVGSPSTYLGALSVASIEGAKTPYLLHGETIMYFIESTDRFSKEKDFVGELLGDGVDEMEIEYVLVAGAGRTAADYTGIDVKGKIALIKRGYNTFEEKAALAQEMGAAGVIIYNNVSGDIKMNVGETEIAVCSISQDDGELLAASGSGKIKISRSQMSGPFISDFSSWGPTPDLKMKPEITAHGGSILSAVPGEDYDRISGTSMATPNISGVAALLRQYVIDKFGFDREKDAKEITATVNRLMMSTADIIINKNGLPYSVRKQGAGLANLNDSAATNAYIVTYDENGSKMDKSKIELGDDKNKTGVYTFDFGIYNFGSAATTYSMGYYVLTEGVSDTKTSHGETTVTETAYALSGATVAITGIAGGTISEDRKQVTVPAGATTHLTVTITLSDSDKKYLDDNFENGGYVEGFITLCADGEDRSQDLNLPYLAFYGDWTQAPILDLDYFETNKDELDDSIDPLDKTLPDGYATRPIGGSSGDFIGYLGSYFFEQDPNNKIIAADRKFIAISNQNQYGEMNSLRFVWAGMLRGAARIEVVITDSVTGEVVFTASEDYVRKSYGEGGPIAPANVDIEFSAVDQNLKNNTQYTVTMKAYLDYGDGGVDTNLNNEFTFPLTTDFTAPMLTDCEFYTEYDRSTKKTRLFAKLAIYDNHYAMAFRPGYVVQDESGQDVFYAFDKYAVPIYSEFNSENYVVYELTDCIDTIMEVSKARKEKDNKNVFTVSCYDYAMNLSTFDVALPDDFKAYGFETEDGAISNELHLTLSPNEIYNLTPIVYPATEWSELVTYAYDTADGSSVASVINNKIIAKKAGAGTVIYARTKDNKHLATIYVTVLSPGDDGYKKYDKPVADSFTLTSFLVNKAFYKLDNTDRDIGTTGETINFPSTSYYSLSLYPSESVTLIYELHAYFPSDTKVVFESGNEAVVKIDANGTITAVAEGLASVTAKVMMDGKSTLYSATVNIEVKEPYITSGPTLSNYFGAGDDRNHVDLSIADLAITEIGQFAFSNYDYVDKGPNDEISDEAPETMKMWYLGDNTIKKVTIPEGVERIGPYAFANMTALEEVVFPSTLTTIDYGAFIGCTKLKTVSLLTPNGVEEGNGFKYVKFINQAAFQGCALSGNLNLEGIVAIANYAFAENSSITGVALSSKLQSIGAYAFGNNTSLKSLSIAAEKIKLGQYAFTDCTALEAVAVNAAVIPTGAFNNCTALKNVTLGADVSLVGEYAFRGTAVEKFTLSSKNTYFTAKNGGEYLISSEGNEISLVAPAKVKEFVLNDPAITSVGNGAFSGCTKLTKVSLPYVTTVGDFGFSECDRLESINFGTLTSVGKYAFEKTAISYFEFSKELTIGEYAFMESKLISVTIPDGYKIPEGAFANCAKLESVTIGDNVTIGENAFFNNNWHAEFIGTESREMYDSQNDKMVKKDIPIYKVAYDSPIALIKIGKNAVIEGGAFYGAASVEEISLGSGASIGEYAFYNCASLKYIDLSGVISIGESAFSGDIHYRYQDEDCSVVDITPENTYTYDYFAPAIVYADLSSVTSLGANAFSLCESLKEVKLGNALKSIGDSAFRLCKSLTTVNLGMVEEIAPYAFAECDLSGVIVSSAKVIGDYAFCYNEKMSYVLFGAEDAEIGEGAFSYCNSLATVGGENKIAVIGDYAFAHTKISKFDLSSLKELGAHAFYVDVPEDGKKGSDNRPALEVILTEKLEKIGDNPFANRIVAPFSTTVEGTFGGNVIDSLTAYTFDLSDSVKIIDGSVYKVVPSGLVLIAWLGGNMATVADDTVRVGDMAFISSGVQQVVLPYTVGAIGHKAFFGCNALQFVSFSGYQAPILEELYDYAYYESMEHIPFTGQYTYADTYKGKVTLTGIEIVPFYMRYVTSLPANFFYGANFVDYIGHVESKIAMIRPVNGKCYDNFVMSKYFSLAINGAAAADDTTLAAIAALNKLPTDSSSITLDHKALVAAARAAYDKITSDEQRALIPAALLDALKGAEQMIEDLEYLSGNNEPTPIPPAEESEIIKILNIIIVVVIILAICVIGLVVSLIYFIKSMKRSAIGTSTPAATVIPATDSSDYYCDEEEYEETAEAEEEEIVEDEPDVPFEKVIYDKPVDYDDITEGYVDKEAVKRKKKLTIIISAVAAAVVLTAGILWAVLASEGSVFDAYEKAGYTVSVTFDSNGGTFKGSDSSIIDLYNPDNIGSDGLKLLAPDDERRDKNNVMTVTKADHFLAGWYTERKPIDENDLSKGYTYSGKWDFESDRVMIDPSKEYSADESVLTLYAAWVPYYEFEIYANDENGNLTLISSVSALELTIPEWHEDDVYLNMDNFPERKGYTLTSVYYLENMIKVEGELDENDSKRTIAGEWDELTATSKTPTIKLFTEWDEGKLYKIDSAKDLAENADLDGYYEITGNLDFKDVAWPQEFLNGKFNGKINGNGYTISGVSFESTSRSRLTNGMFSSLSENAKIENVKFKNITHTIDLMTVAKDATFGLLAGTVSEGAVFSNVSLSGKLVFGDSCAALAGSDDFTIKTIAASGDVSGINANEILVEKQNTENTAFDLKIDNDGTVTIVSGT